MLMTSGRANRIADKRNKEQEVVTKMVLIYCRGHRHATSRFCPDCQSLLEYAVERIERCPFMETKTFCSTCPVHCYQEDMRAKIKDVMRYSGPRMLYHHPILAVRHLIETIRT
jgi:predicted amidophosphoribosyltransferase